MGSFVQIAFKIQDDCGQLYAKELVLQNTHPDASVNFQSDATGKKIQQDDPKGSLKINRIKWKKKKTEKE